MKTFATNLMIAALCCLTLAGTAAAQGKNKSKTITLAEDVLVKDQLVEKGVYRVQFDAAKEEVTLLREGKPVLTTKVMVKEGSQKSPYSSAHFTTTPKGQMLTTLTFEGDKRILHLHDGQLSTADGQELDQ